MILGSSRRSIKRLGATVLIAAVVCAVAGTAHLHAEHLVFKATEAGGRTLDEGEGGGNPFASAVVELLASPRVTLAQLPPVLQRLTEEKSRGFQYPEVPHSLRDPDWTIVPREPGESRIALVLVTSDYSRSGGAQSLPGARRDAQRITAAFRKAGFATETAVDLDISGIRRTLARFAVLSHKSDAAVIYTTGHGVEVSGNIYLLPGDYPVGEKNDALDRRAIRLSEVVGSTMAKRVNLIFYGGCRDNPFGE